jgi:hypothetical protein
MLLNSWASFTRWVWRCWRDPLQRLALIAGLASAACLGLLAGPPYFSTASVPQRWTFDPGLEVQTVTDAEDLRLTLGDAPSQDRETMRLKVKIDFAFIAFYGTLLVTLGLIAARSGGWRRLVGVAAALCAVAAGVFDVLENLAILDVLDVPISATTETMLEAIRQPSTTKWSLAAACAVLLLSHYESTFRSAISSSLRSSSR